MGRVGEGRKRSLDKGKQAFPLGWITIHLHRGFDRPCSLIYVQLVDYLLTPSSVKSVWHTCRHGGIKYGLKEEQAGKKSLHEQETL